LSISEVKSEIFDKTEDCEIDRYESFDSYYNEEINLTLNVEYEEVTYVEIGVIINDDDDYNWNK
jgi:hypothetical protein